MGARVIFVRKFERILKRVELFHVVQEAGLVPQEASVPVQGVELVRPAEAPL